jgi:glycosyltransferase involved in cell wall biosynthesis
MPKYSICIPTRERDVTLRSAIETVLAQAHPDFELIIQDNVSSPATHDVVDSFDDPRIRYFRSERRLAMHVNWEEALRHASGDYILFIGDDDALMPDCLERADPLLRAMDPDILAWPGHLYYWPDCPDPAHRNLLTIDNRSGSIWTDGYADDPFGSNISARYPHRPAGTLVFDSRKIAQAWYAWKGVRLYVPLYHNFVHRRIVDRIRSQFGRYFLDPTPDFASLALNAYFSKTILFYSRALSMSGHSGRSNGGTHGNSEASKKSLATFFAEANVAIEDIFRADFPPLSWIPSILYACFENVRRQAFPDDYDLPRGMKEFIYYAAGEVANQHADQQEQCREWVKYLAARHGVPSSELSFPEPKPYVRPKGIQSDAHGRVYYTHIDGHSAGLRTISQAVRLASNFSPQSDFPISQSHALHKTVKIATWLLSAHGPSGPFTRKIAYMGIQRALDAVTRRAGFGSKAGTR